MLILRRAADGRRVRAMREVTIKAVRQGMVVSVPDDLAWDGAIAALEGKLSGAGGLVAGQKAQLLLGARSLDAMALGALVGKLARSHQLEAAAVVSASAPTCAAAEACGLAVEASAWTEGSTGDLPKAAPAAPAVPAPTPASAAPVAPAEAPVAAEHPPIQADSAASALAAAAPALAAPALVGEGDAEGVQETDPSGNNALYLRQTVRGGQMIRHDGTIVIAGDVNPGAEVVATGDIIVFGNLRGLAHAGAAGDGDAQIIAVNLRPTQIRIAGFMARSPDQGAPPLSKHPEVARVLDGEIHITPLKDLA